MRKAFGLVFFFLATEFVCANASALRINEISRAHELPVALQHVSIEVYNSGAEVIDMRGMRFHIGSAFEEIEQQLLIAPGDFEVFHFGKKNRESLHDLSLKLSWQGGTVMLWSSDGLRLLDVFTYPELLEEGSFGRCPDGAVNAAYGEHASIGLSCAEVLTKSKRAGKVSVKVERRNSDADLALSADHGSIHYTLDGSEPTKASPVFPGTLTIQQNTLLRARAFQDGMQPGPVLLESIVFPEQERRSVALALSEADLWNEDEGIYVKGSHANFSRKGKTWERSVTVNCTEGNEWRKDEYGVRISGSGTRSLPKRSFKIFRRDRYGDSPMDFFTGIDVDEVVLRADGTPNSFLRNVFVEEVANEFAGLCDVQISRPMDLYLNGAYWGAYRAMPAKDPEWIEVKHGVRGIDMLAGSAHRVVSGTHEGWDEVMELLSKNELDHERLARLEELVDVESMIQVAAFDLYTGRADGELNTRAWREPGGKWRWIIYDFDLWALPDDPSLMRMLMEPGPAAPFMNTIWNTSELKARFLAYLSAMFNGPLHPEEAQERLERIMQPEYDHLIRDHELWSDRMKMMHPDEGLAEMKEHVAKRAGFLVRNLAGAGNMSVAEVPLAHSKGGSLVLDGIAISKHAEAIQGFAGVVMLLEARPDPGMRFSHWIGTDSSSPLMMVELDKLEKVEAVFVKKEKVRP